MLAGAATAWTLRVTLDAALLGMTASAITGVTPKQFLAENGLRALAAVAALGLALMTLAVGISDARMRWALAALAVLTLLYPVWRRVLNDTERAALSRMLRDATSGLRKI